MRSIVKALFGKATKSIGVGKVTHRIKRKSKGVEQKSNVKAKLTVEKQLTQRKSKEKYSEFINGMKRKENKK